MPNNGIDRALPHATICVIGPSGHGKSAMTDTLARVAAERGWPHVRFGSDFAAADVVLLVISAVAGLSPDARAQLRLAWEANVSHLVIALDEVDKVDDPELLDLVELEVRESVRQCGYADTLPVVHLSARNDLHGSKRVVAGVVRLMETLDRYISVDR